MSMPASKGTSCKIGIFRSPTGFRTLSSSSSSSSQLDRWKVRCLLSTHRIRWLTFLAASVEVEDAVAGLRSSAASAAVSRASPYVRFHFEPAFAIIDVWLILIFLGIDNIVCSGATHSRLPSESVHTLRCHHRVDLGLAHPRQRLYITVHKDTRRCRIRNASMSWMRANATDVGSAPLRARCVGSVRLRKR
jgi:hypothetical protein